MGTYEDAYYNEESDGYNPSAIVNVELMGDITFISINQESVGLDYKTIRKMSEELLKITNKIVADKHKEYLDSLPEW